MKPSWDDAPAWAMWLAMDECGRWSWFETPPKAIELGIRGIWGDVRGRVLDCSFSNWLRTLEKRPNSLENIPDGEFRLPLQTSLERRPKEES